MALLYTVFRKCNVSLMNGWMYKPQEIFFFMNRCALVQPLLTYHSGECHFR